jgi:hypothetical protein
VNIVMKFVLCKGQGISCFCNCRHKGNTQYLGSFLASHLGLWRMCQFLG